MSEGSHILASVKVAKYFVALTSSDFMHDIKTAMILRGSRTLTSTNNVRGITLIGHIAIGSTDARVWTLCIIYV